MKTKLMISAYLLLIGIVCFSQTDTINYSCNNCANVVFNKSEVIKENKKNIFILYNKAPNKVRDSSTIKDVHCAYCNSHIGYCNKEGEVNILPKNIHKKGTNYECSICKKPLLKQTDLINKEEESYHFAVKNNKSIEIGNRSFIISNKQVYCSFCYEIVGVKKKNSNLKIKKDKVH